MDMNARGWIQMLIRMDRIGVYVVWYKCWQRMDMMLIQVKFEACYVTRWIWMTIQDGFEDGFEWQYRMDTNVKGWITDMGILI